MDILNVDQITKRFRKRQIIKNISFSIREGEIVGLVGPNGAGKTTTIKLITNLLRADSGKITICGHDITKEREKALECLSAVVETPGLYAELSGRDNVEFFRKVRGVPKDKADRLIEAMGMQSRIDDKVRKYSLGMKQRLALIICLLSDPKILILDEPTNGLDPTGTIELRNLIIKQSRERHTTVLISSHILAELEKMCDRIIFIREGEIVSSKPDEKYPGSQVLKLRISESEKIDRVVEACGYIFEYMLQDSELIVRIDKNRIHDFMKSLIAEGVDFSGLEVVSSLENEYIHLFGEE